MLPVTSIRFPTDSGAAGPNSCDTIVVMNIQSKSEGIAVATEPRRSLQLIGVPHDAADLQYVNFNFAMAALIAANELAATGRNPISFIGHRRTCCQRDNHVTQAKRAVAI